MEDILDSGEQVLREGQVMSKYKGASGSVLEVAKHVHEATVYVYPNILRHAPTQQEEGNAEYANIVASDSEESNDDDSEESNDDHGATHFVSSLISTCCPSPQAKSTATATSVETKSKSTAKHDERPSKQQKTTNQTPQTPSKATPTSMGTPKAKPLTTTNTKGSGKGQKQPYSN